METLPEREIRLPASLDSPTEATRRAFEDPVSTSWISKATFWARAASFSPTQIADQIRSSCPVLPKENRGLEAGCGMGYKSRLFRETIRSLGGELSVHLALDLSESALRIAQEKGDASEYLLGNYLDLPKENPSRKFDYIFLAAVLHHAYDIRESLEIISQLLPPNGIGIILDVFLPEHPPLEKLGRLSHKAYSILESRREAYYNLMTISELQEKVFAIPQLRLRSAKKLSGAPSWLGMMNTRAIIIQKEEE